MTEPRDFQARAVQHHRAVLSRLGASCDASVPGAGKTFIASFLAREMGHELVVLCPKVVRPHWRHAAELCGAKVRCVDNYEQYKLGHTGMGRWKIKSRQWVWDFPRPSLLVFDEAHYCKSRVSQNAKLMTAAHRQRIPTLALSATLAVDPCDLYATGVLLGLHSGDFFDWQAFQRRYGAVHDGFGFVFSPQSDPGALRRLHSVIFPEHGHRVTYADIPGFPEATTSVMAVDADPQALEQLAAVWADVQALEALHKDAPTAVVARLRARQMAELAKVPAIIDLARDLLTSGLSVPIFLEFRQTIDAVASALKADVIDGRTSDSERTWAIAAFQGDASRVLVLQTGAGGVGISLHDTHGLHPRHAILSPGDNARNFIQALGRNRRLGQRSPAFRTILTLAGSVEEKVRRALEKKCDQVDTINDGDLDPL